MAVPDFSNAVFDAALNYIRNRTERVVACTSDPSTYADVAAATVVAAAVSASDFEPPADLAGKRRSLQFKGKSGATATGTGVPSCIIFVNDTDSEIIAKVTQTAAISISPGATVSFPSMPIAFNNVSSS